MSFRARIGQIVLTAFLAAGFAAGVNFGDTATATTQSTLTWVAPLTTSDLRIGRKPEGSQAGPDTIDTGSVARFCSGTVSLPGGNQLSCKLEGADTGYQYFLCARDQAGENLGGFECSFHGNGGGWECTPADIAASWCD